MSAATMLANIETAIEQCLTSQEYTTERGRSLQRARLKDLQEMHAYFSNLAESEGAGSMSSLGQILPVK